jgi:Flp pilus assembly protein TadD
MSDSAQDWLEKFGQAESPEIALVCLERALEVDPEFVPALGCKGTLLGQLGRDDEALACFEQIVEIDPDSGAAHYSVGLHLQNLGRIGEAIEAYTKATEVAPEDPDAWVNRGRLLDERGEPAQAIADYDRALALNDGEEIAWCNRGNSLMALERFDDAVESFERALALQAESLPARLGLSSALMCLGRIEEANAKRPQGTPYDRGPALERLHDLPSGRELVVRYYPQKHSNPEHLEEIANNLLEYCAGLETTPPGLEDGVRVGFMWSLITLRAQGERLVLCEPAFDRHPFSEISYDLTFTLQTAFMLQMLHSLTKLPPCDCTFAQAIAIQRGVIDRAELTLIRLHETNEAQISGWFVGPGDSEQAQALLESEDYDLVPTAALVGVRPHLIKVLTLPPGCTVRFQEHKVVSVRDAAGDEVWDQD